MSEPHSHLPHWIFKCNTTNISTQRDNFASFCALSWMKYDGRKLGNYSEQPEGEKSYGN